MRILQKIRKTIQLAFFVGAITGLGLVLTNCSDDGGGEEEPDTLAGVYIFESAVLGTEVNIAGGGSLPASTDVTDEFVGAILDSSPCSNTQSTAVDLRKTGTAREVYYICTDDSGDATKQGIWSENADLTQMTMVLSIQGADVQLVLNDVVRTSTSLSGTITLPGFVFGIIIGQTVTSATVETEVVFKDV